MRRMRIHVPFHICIQDCICIYFRFAMEHFYKDDNLYFCLILCYLYLYFYSYMHHPCKGTLFTWAVIGMIHPVICDGGEITPAEEVADKDCILHSHLYLYLQFSMNLCLYPTCSGKHPEKG